MVVATWSPPRSSSPCRRGRHDLACPAHRASSPRDRGRARLRPATTARNPDRHPVDARDRASAGAGADRAAGGAVCKAGYRRRAGLPPRAGPPPRAGVARALDCPAPAPEVIGTCTTLSSRLPSRVSAAQLCAGPRTRAPASPGTAISRSDLRTMANRYQPAAALSPVCDQFCMDDDEDPVVLVEPAPPCFSDRLEFVAAAQPVLHRLLGHGRGDDAIRPPLAPPLP